MNDKRTLGPWVRRFLMEHLPDDRNLSRNTQQSYRDALRLLIVFAAGKVRKKADTIRAWLGHVSLDTTNVYAETDLDMKAKALGMCEQSQPPGRKRWRDNPDLLNFLAQL